MAYFYLSLQYSAIQKVVLRYDHLWSLSGISHMLSRLNEIDMQRIVKENNGEILIGAGGKLTARFQNLQDAENTKEKLTKLVSTTLPMLEFQISEIVESQSFQVAQETVTEGRYYPGIVHELSERKNCFRGYGVTYNPHFAVCEECEEYPFEVGLKIGDTNLCRICHAAKKSASVDLNELMKKDVRDLSSIEKVYRGYLELISSPREPLVPMDMEDMFEEKNDTEERRWIAVWMSDINNMNTRIELWNLQEEERILETYMSLKQLFIDSIVDTLSKVFRESSFIRKDGEEFVPFRLIVAGGDDFCIVMPHKFIVDFTLEYSRALDERVRDAQSYHKTLTNEWLMDMATKTGKNISELGEISFGGAFVVTPIHTPFSRIHEAGERLMSEAKSDTDRIANSVNWQILALGGSLGRDHILEKREKPLLVERPVKGRLSFREYVKLSKKHEKLSKSQMFSIIEGIVHTNGDGKKLKRLILRFPDAQRANSAIARILEDQNLQEDGKLSSERLLTMFEIMNLKKEEDTENER